MRHAAPAQAGHHPRARRRALRRSRAKGGRLGDGFFPGKGDHAELERLFGVARQAAFEAGRNPDVLTFTSGGNGAIGSRALDEVGELAAMGVTRVVLPSFLFWQDTEEALARYGAEIIAKAP